MTGLTLWARVYSIIGLLNYQGGGLKSLIFNDGGDQGRLFLSVTFDSENSNFQGLFCSPDYFRKVSIPPLHEFVGMDDERAA